MCLALLTWVLEYELRLSCLHSKHFMYWVWLLPQWIIYVCHSDHGLMGISLHHSLGIAKWWTLNLVWILTSILWLIFIVPNLQVKNQAEGRSSFPESYVFWRKYTGTRKAILLLMTKHCADVKVQDPEVKNEIKTEMQKERGHVPINANSWKALGWEHLIEKDRACLLNIRIFLNRD